MKPFYLFQGQQIKQGKISDLKEDNATTWIPDSDQEREEELVSQDRELLLKNGGLQGKNVSLVQTTFWSSIVFLC